jgi:alkanesulfonate monooxygenase
VSVDFKGDYFTVSDARVSAPPDPGPQIYFGGSSSAALPIAAQYVDAYLTWGEPPHAAAANIEKVRALAEQRGRNVRFGIRLHTISRDTAARRGRSPTSSSCPATRTWRRPTGSPRACCRG